VKISGAGTSQDIPLFLPQTVTCHGHSEVEAEAPSDLSTEDSSSDHSDIDELALGEFLLETFDSTEVQDNTFVHTELPI